VLSKHSSGTGTTSLYRAYGGAALLCHRDLQPARYRVLASTVSALGIRRVVVESTGVPGCPACGVVSVPVKDRRLQRLRDVPLAGGRCGAMVQAALLLRAHETLSDRARARLRTVFETDDPTGQLRVLLASGSLEEAGTTSESSRASSTPAPRRRRSGWCGP
jgi:hypothetical protein